MRPVVVIGGGFAGLTLAQHLEKRLDPSESIVVVSRDNYLVFTPMLAEVTARTVSPNNVIIAGRQATKRTRWIAATVSRVDRDARVVHFVFSHGGEGSIEYGDLVVACGLDSNLDAVPGMAAHALPLKSVIDAMRLGDGVIDRFEAAVIAPDAAAQARLLTTIVVGGGFSGVEIAGHLHDLALGARRYYRLSDGVEPRTVLLQRGRRIIPEFQHEALSEFACAKLRANGIEVRLETGVREVSRSEVHLDSGERIAYGLLAGTVGTTASAFVKSSGLPLERHRLVADGEMRVRGEKAVWAIGDCAAVPNAFDGKESPPTAQFALRQAARLAENIATSRRGNAPAPFSFKPLGLLASIGHRNGVAEIGGVMFSGFFAWILWRAVYLFKTPSLSRRIGVAINWIMDAAFPQAVVRIGDLDVARLRREHYAAGDAVYSAGEPSHTLYLIHEGTARVLTDDESDRAIRLSPGEQFGISAAERYETPHSTTVVAESSLDVIAFERPAAAKMSRDTLTREMLRLLDLRRMRRSLPDVLKRFPEARHLRVADTMDEAPVILGESDTLETAAERLVRAAYLPVVDGRRRLVGSCRRRDVDDALARGVAFDTPVAAFVSSETVVLSAAQSLRSAIGEYVRSGNDLLPVVDDDGLLVGTFGLIEAARTVRRRSARNSAEMR